MFSREFGIVWPSSRQLYNRLSSNRSFASTPRTWAGTIDYVTVKEMDI